MNRADRDHRNVVLGGVGGGEVGVRWGQGGGEVGATGVKTIALITCP